ncbi:MAG: hypothetical protein WBA93_16960 [Microcoleaceae cyanobacterium]
MKPVLTKATEVDGISFETWISEAVLIIPPKEVDAYTPVEWGISVANNSPNSYRFVFFNLVPEIVNVNRHLQKFSSTYCNYLSRSDRYL